ncbi:hypothetical protein [Nocardia farcinica]|uniref:hypothetical protein n=1 Tax=Nocardia farcinica TaxID=37329 RepID=UPI001894FD5D|nr:hypothetical protein [Nocardia farcinica]MBF6520572.1 hypothetical protein [Nocardia farcinica]
MAGGFFNHYDDPDEFWDDEPLRPPTRPVSRGPDAAATSGMTLTTATGACVALVTFLGAQAKAIGDIDRSFPDGKWPDSQATSFNDASVEGDDKSSWKIA